MASKEAGRLSQTIRQKAEEMRKICQGLDEKTASRAPAGRWSPKQIITHMSGPEGVGLVSAVKLILEKDTPLLDLEAENPFFTEKRSRMTMADLLKEMQGEYGRMADIVAGLSDEQLQRKAHIPLFKELPMGEYPTLAMFVEALAGHHMEFHIDHMNEVLKELGAAGQKTG